MTVIGAVVGGKYRVLAKLGEGGMGAVFRAENQLTGKQVAIKCLQPELSANAEASERLLREARTASSLSHPNIVDVYDVVQDGDTLVLVMELLQGETLGSYLLRQPMPKLRELVSLMLPAMAGVAAAHERGVIHRDLKPENIFLERVAGADQPIAKVLDFGVAKLLTTRSKTLTHTGMTLGTPLYMSFEQLRGDKDLDERADVYAFGAMLYEAVTGRLPYEADTVPELAIKVATSDAPAVRALRPDVPGVLAQVIDRAIARDRAQRLPDVRALMQRLQAFLNDAKSLPETRAAALTGDVTPTLLPREADTLDAHELVGPRAPRQKLFSLWAALGVALTTTFFVVAFGLEEPAPDSPPLETKAAPALAAPGPRGPHPLLAPGPDSVSAAHQPAPAARPAPSNPQTPSAITRSATDGRLPTAAAPAAPSKAQSEAAPAALKQGALAGQQPTAAASQAQAQSEQMPAALKQGALAGQQPTAAAPAAASQAQAHSEQVPAVVKQGAWDGRQLPAAASAASKVQSQSEAAPAAVKQGALVGQQPTAASKAREIVPAPVKQSGAEARLPAAAESGASKAQGEAAPAALKQGAWVGRPASAASTAPAQNMAPPAVVKRSASDVRQLPSAAPRKAPAQRELAPAAVKRGAPDAQPPTAAPASKKKKSSLERIGL